MLIGALGANDAVWFQGYEPPSFPGNTKPERDMLVSEDRVPPRRLKGPLSFGNVHAKREPCAVSWLRAHVAGSGWVVTHSAVSPRPKRAEGLGFRVRVQGLGLKFQDYRVVAALQTTSM